MAPADGGCAAVTQPRGRVAQALALVAVLFVGILSCGSDLPTRISPDTVGSVPPAAPSPARSTHSSGRDAVGSHAADLGSFQREALTIPARIRIPSREVDATVEGADVGTDGELLVPALASRVVWYQAGSVPSAPGTAVLAGHVDYNGVEGAFAQLSRLGPGDTIEITDLGGKTSGFQVVARQLVRKDQLAVAELTHAQGPPRLALVTCGGDFDHVRRTYVSNVVVWAVPTQHRLGWEPAKQGLVQQAPRLRL